MLLTTQYLDEADRLADRIAVIDRGLVIAEGTPRELKGQVGGERLDIHLCDEQRGDEAVAALASIASDRPFLEDGSVRVPVAERRGTIADAVRRLDDAGIAIDDISVSTPTLDDVFLTLTGHAAEHEGEEAEAAVAVKALRYGISDTLVLAKRSLLRIPRQPDLLVGFTIQPILFILLFVYVFGGAIKTPGFDYVDFLMPGIIVQSIVFGGFVTALGLPDDLKKGLIDRFRSLPMTRSALLTGRTLGDVVTNIFQLVVMFTVGLLIGFNFSSSVGEVVAGILLLLLIGYAFSWVFAFIGLSSSSPEAANAYGFTILFPVTFVSSAFVPVDDDAELAPADRRAQPVHEHGQRRPRAVPRHPGREQRLAGAGLDARDHRRLRAALGLEVQARRRTVRIVLRDGLELEDPLEATIRFVEAFPGYDSRDSPPSSFDESDLRHANRGGARISAAQIAAILERRRRIESALRSIAPEASLADEFIPWPSLLRLFDAFAEISGIGFSKMTKALHPKRPALIPMLDSVVQAYLAADEATASPASFGARAAALVESYKQDLDQNLDALSQVQRDLLSRGYRPLTEVRILDVLIWSAYAPVS